MVDIKSDDSLLLNNLLRNMPSIIREESISISKDVDSKPNRIYNLEFPYPFDEEIITLLNYLAPSIKKDDSDSLYNEIGSLKDLWFKLMDKSIKCLRFFDSREPYLQNRQKEPQSYGIEELELYYNEFAEFEALLYGSNRFYRDHVIHLFRTWLIGLNILINDNKEVLFYKEFQFEGISKEKFSFNFFECISIWTIAALCHDLGYPLEKVQDVINKTQRMMGYLVSHPKIEQDITFSGTQDKLNEYIIRLISSRMRELEVGQEDNQVNKLYHARTQSKYYIKYSKSLSDYCHGIISAIIIYKSLLYFLESDFSLHDDYAFDYEEAKQFYIRRDILRTISSHTCKDVYHMLSNTFPLLLIISDDLQEWGRKSWQDFFKKNNNQKTEFKLRHYDKNSIVIEYIFEGIHSGNVNHIIKSFFNNYKKFQKLFRDGEDTAKRDFSFHIYYSLRITRSNKIIIIKVSIPAKETSSFAILCDGYKQKTQFKKDLGDLDEIGKISFEDDFNVIL